MPDISMCMNKDCSKKETCYRFKVKPDEYRQAYCLFKQNKDGSCDYYWEDK